MRYADANSKPSTCYMRDRKNLKKTTSTAKMKLGTSASQTLRTGIRLAVLISTALQGCGHFFFLRLRGKITTLERARWLHRWCAKAIDRLQIELQPEGAFPSRGLLVANHLGYLDIMVLSAMHPCVFVAKQEVRSWPLFGLMAKLSGTVFVDRARTTAAHSTNAEMSNALAQGAVVVLFPEGTSSDGSKVLPFRPALFDAATKAGANVVSAHISYDVADGSAANDVCYWGEMSFFPHLLRLLSRHQIRARVRFAAETRKFADRKLAARVTRETVASLAQMPALSTARASTTSLSRSLRQGRQ
jgi:1-acyl-sn-glycerol-3-phosphate acyltransferase